MAFDDNGKPLKLNKILADKLPAFVQNQPKVRDATKDMLEKIQKAKKLAKKKNEG